MRTQVIENLVNTIEKIAEDTGLSEDEYLRAQAISMATLMKRKGSNLMDIDINELTLSEAGASVH